MKKRLTILEDYDLRAHNSFAISARSRYFCSVRSIDELRQALAAAAHFDVPVLVLGGGSNVLFVQDYTGMVIHIALQGITIAAAEESSVIVTAAAGENWHHLVSYCLNQGYHGLENLALIPGNVGAAPVQNIGAYGVELKDFFVELSALLTDSGEIVSMNLQQCHFAYRDSIFKQELKNRAVVLSVSLRLSTEPLTRTAYSSLHGALVNHPGPVMPADVFSAVCEIRRSRLPDPAVLGNAGSFFKNPLIPVSDYLNLRASYPNMPAFSVNPQSSSQDDPADSGLIKIPAAWLIEKAGWKGKRMGAVGVHTEQALVLVNYGGGTGQQLLDLAVSIQESVARSFGIQLEAEVRVL
jgi:UDP-N-acetylmuramate dehydrogenase